MNAMVATIPAEMHGRVAALLRCMADECKDCMRKSTSACMRCNATQAKNILKDIKWQESVVIKGACTNAGAQRPNTVLEDSILTALTPDREMIMREISLAVGYGCSSHKVHYAIRRLHETAQVEPFGENIPRVGRKYRLARLEARRAS